jgi:DeoR/GlpR family transcriptional regulator of sugar metabolism
VCSISEIDLLITDVTAPDQAVALIEQSAVSVHRA